MAALPAFYQPMEERVKVLGILLRQGAVLDGFALVTEKK